MVKKKRLSQLISDLFIPERITHFFIIVLFAVFPLWVGTEGYFNISFHKFRFLVVVVVLWVLLLLLSMLKTKNSIKMTFDKWIVVVIVLIALLSSVISHFQEHVWNGSGSYNGFLSVLLYGIIYIGVSSFGKPKSIYIGVLMISVGICCVIALVQLFGKNPLGLYPNNLSFYDAGIYYSSEFLGCIGNVDIFSSLLCLSIPIAFCLFPPNGKTTMITLIICFSLFIAIYINVASGVISLIGTLIICTIYSFRINKRLMILIPTVFICCFFLAKCVNITPDGIRIIIGTEENGAVNKDLDDIHSFLEGDLDDSMGSGRIGIWRKTLAEIPEKPLIGTGPGTVIDRVHINYIRYVEESHQYLRSTVDNAHNDFLEIMITIGILGLFAYFLLIFITFKRVIRKTESINMVFLFGVCGYGIQSFFNTGSFFVLPIVSAIWAMTNAD